MDPDEYADIDSEDSEQLLDLSEKLKEKKIDTTDITKRITKKPMLKKQKKLNLNSPMINRKTYHE
jgi:hypothetical protein